jgi:hypothetical protein
MRVRCIVKSVFVQTCEGGERKLKEGEMVDLSPQEAQSLVKRKQAEEIKGAKTP